ncbi:HAD-like superfamily [Arabidopsis suecica]|uniref:HAD-like superfamily n=1 Tax=Arabidopsis suecica TaxID=45249 RepID=A0A8T2AIE0_ARASU|nr:HAD-like superfamily [Arabidopsis suecica]
MDFSPINCLIFDLDDTLYPLKTGIAPAVKKNIDDFLVEKFGFSESKASSLRVELFKTYGSTLAGLRALGHDVHPDEYHSVVHGRLPYGSIEPNKKLRNLLNKIKQRKIIFTNSDRNHAVKVLKKLGLQDCFEEMICFETMNPNLFGSTTRPDEHPVVLKPSLTAMDICIRVANVDPRRTVFLDDNIHNITAGKSVGLRTILVGRAEKMKDADYAVETVTEIATAVPEIWKTATATGGFDVGGERIRRSKSELEGMASITAVGA